MGNGRAQIYPVDPFLALERSTDAIAAVSRFWSSEILSKSAVIDELHRLPAPFRAMLTLQADNGRSRPARVCARCYGGESFFERTGFQPTLQARARASRHMRIGGLLHPGHCGALGRMGDRVNEHLEERIVEIVTWKCLDRLRQEVLRQIVESPSDDIETGADMDQRDLGTLAGRDADRGMKRDGVPDNLAPLGAHTLIFEERVGGVGPDHFEPLKASELWGKSQVMQHRREEEKLFVVTQFLGLADQGAEYKGAHDMSVNNCWRDAERQVGGLLRQGTIGNPDAGDFTRQGVLLGGSCWLGHGFLLEVVKTTSGCKSGGVRGSALGLQLFGKAVEMKCDLLGRF